MAKQQSIWQRHRVYFGVGTGVAILIILYFLVLPGMLARSYKNTALAAQNKIAEKVTAWSEQYKRPAFTKVDTTPEADKADLDATRKALNETREVLSSEKGKITGFKTLPAMTVNRNYQDAKSAATDAKEWVGKSEQALHSGEDDLNYFEKTNQLDTKYENVGKSLENVSGNESPQTLAQKFDQAATEFQVGLNEYRQVQPTESLKKSHEAQLALGDKFAAQLKQLAGALRSEDLGTVDSVGTQIEATVTEVDNEANQSIIDYNREATVNRLILELQVLDRKLEDDFNKF